MPQGGEPDGCQVGSDDDDDDDDINGDAYDDDDDYGDDYDDDKYRHQWWHLQKERFLPGHFAPWVDSSRHVFQSALRYVKNLWWSIWWSCGEDDGDDDNECDGGVDDRGDDDDDDDHADDERSITGSGDSCAK